VLGLLGSLVLVAGGGGRRRRRHCGWFAKAVCGKVVWMFIGEGAQVSQAEETVLRWGMSGECQFTCAGSCPSGYAKRMQWVLRLQIETQWDSLWERQFGV
jgi:hypothetical protein